MALIDLERAVVAVCFDRAPGEAEFAAVGDPRIYRIYRDAVRKRLFAELKVAFKRTSAAAGEVAFERAFERFLAEAPPRTRFFHAVVGSFAASAAPEFAKDPSLPRYTADLCTYEAALWAVDDLPDAVKGGLAEFEFERRAVLSPALRLLALGHAVHEAELASGGYREGEVFLCVHRAAAEKHARTWTLNGVSHALLQRFLTEDETVTDAVHAVARARGIAVDSAFIDGLCSVLADFLERGVILGGR